MKKSFTISTIFLLTIGLLIAYFPFCRMNQLHVTGDLENRILDKLLCYDKLLFLSKGREYRFYHTSIDGDKRDVSVFLRFNFNNTITITSNNKSFSFIVDSIVFSGAMSYAKTLEEIRDFPTFYGICFYDKDANFLCIYRQPRTLPYGSNRVGMEASINGTRMGSFRNGTFFNYENKEKRVLYH